jgi:hypothetical protein
VSGQPIWGLRDDCAVSGQAARHSEGGLGGVAMRCPQGAIYSDRWVLSGALPQWAERPGEGEEDCLVPLRSFFCSEAGSHCINQASVELMILLPQPPK